MSNNTYLLGLQLKFVKELNIFVIAQDLPKVTDILRKHDVGGIAFYEVQGAGRIKRKEIRERDGWSVRTVTPEYEARTKIETIVSDSFVKEIVDDLVGSIGSENEPHGVIFVKDVSNAYEIGTKQSGDTILTQR
jgi:nitrogen regulatory protein P-II 1